MKIKKEEIVKDGNLLGHIVLHSLSRNIEQNNKLMESAWENGYLDIELIINGRQVEGLESFVDRWQGQVERFVKDEAKRLFEQKFSDKFNDIGELIGDLEYRVSEKIEEMKPDWEKELDKG